MALFGTDGVRGLANGPLTADLALTLAQATAVVLGQGRIASARKAAGKRLTAVVARGDTWSGVAASEPYDVAWAGEAVIFLRSLGAEGNPEQARAWVQISPDGMRWVGQQLEQADAH